MPRSSDSKTLSRRGNVERGVAEAGDQGWYQRARDDAQELLDRCTQARGRRFKRVGILSGGYSVRDVDNFADQVTRYLQQGTPLTADEVRSVVFRAQRGGYQETQVDVVLDAVIDLLAGGQTRLNVGGAAYTLETVSGYRRRGAPFTPRVPEEIVERHVRSAWSLPAFATLVTFAFLVVSSVSPNESVAARAMAPAPVIGALEGQTFVIDDVIGDLQHPGAVRDEFAVSRISTAPAVGKPDPGTAKAIAYEMVVARGWSDAEFSCLVALWQRESNWNVNAHNPTSGAHGIPQALPGDKMATVGADWATNPVTQITWGLGYIAGRYGTPCAAWEHSERKNWY